MSRKPRQFVEGEFYHIVLRRLQNEPLFIDADDYYRGIFSLYEFNDLKPARIRERRAARARFKKTIRKVDQGQTSVKTIGLDRSLVMIDKRELVVEILTFCLMSNHIHLLVRELKKGGISKFMQKLGSGLASHFKNKYGIKLRGYFFQDRFTAVHIKTDQQLRIIFVYIHTNPISLIKPKWKEEGITNPKKVIEFVENYKWSSYPDYIGKKNFPSLTKRELMLKIMGNKNGCREWVNGWIRRKEEMRKLMKKSKDFSLE